MLTLTRMQMYGSKYMVTTASQIKIQLDDPNRDDFEKNRYLTSSIQSPEAYGAFLLTGLTAIFKTNWYKRKRKKNFLKL